MAVLHLGPVAHSGERRTCTAEVAGAKPVRSTKLRRNIVIGLSTKRTKLDPSPQQPPLSKKDQNPKSFKRVVMGIRKGSNAQATGKYKNNGINVY